LTDADQELYKNFSITISERWQNEVAETVFETVNSEADKADQKRKSRQKKFNEHNEEGIFIIKKKHL
jgi:beta-adrenergic-receptor kinase